MFLTTEQYFLVVLYIMLYKVVPSFDSVPNMNQKATEHNFPVVLLFIPYQMVFTFESAVEKS